MKPCAIASYVKEGTLHIRVAGRATFVMAGQFGAFIAAQFVVPPDDVVIDLTQAEYLDSTMLGQLASIARRLKQHNRRKPTLLCRSGDVALLLDNIGFDTAFTIAMNSGTDVGPFQPIPTPDNRQPSAAAMLEAHQLLMDLNERNRRKFADTVNALRQYQQGTPSNGDASP